MIRTHSTALIYRFSADFLNKQLSLMMISSTVWTATLASNIANYCSHRLCITVDCISGVSVKEKISTINRWNVDVTEWWNRSDARRQTNASMQTHTRTFISKANDVPMPYNIICVYVIVQPVSEACKQIYCMPHSFLPNTAKLRQRRKI